MKSIFTKKVLVIVSVVAFVALSAIVIAFSTGNINYPGLSNPDEVFYQRLDEQGNVVYSITNQELFEEIKGNDGIQQLLFMTDSFLLAEYISNVTDEEVADKLLELTYGTSDADLLADLTDDQTDNYDDAFAQTMTLAGFSGNEDDYAKLIIAREKYALEYADEEGIITESSVISEYLNGYFEDLSAINIRFTSKADAQFVMQKFHLVTLPNEDLRLYNGYVFSDESLLNGDSEIIEAYSPLGIYYFNDDNNIVDIDGEVVYTAGVHGIYTDADDIEYQLDATTGDLLNTLLDVVVDADLIFDDAFDAEVYEAANTEYYTVTRTDAFDKDETINVLNDNSEVVYTIDPDGHIWDALGNDVTHTTTLVVNKVYTEIKDVVTVTEDNSTELTENEILAKYIEMYNYVYSNYRTALATDATSEDLIALNNANLSFNYEETVDYSVSIANYLFKTLSIALRRRD